MPETINPTSWILDTHYAFLEQRSRILKPKEISKKRNLPGMEVGERAWRVTAVFLQILRTVPSTSTTRFVR